MTETVSVRIQEADLDEITTISTYEKKGKSAVLREVLELGIKDKKLEIALEQFRNNQATAWKAAQIAGRSFSEFLEVVAEKGIDFHYGVKEVREDFEGLL